MSSFGNIPVTLLFRCDLRDTAALVGLVEMKKRIGTIAYTGPLEMKNLDYIGLLNSWLRLRGQPIISIHPHLKVEQLERIVDPISEWGWKTSECVAAINLAGLPLPN
tara:strand:+ start:33334 stop:33654 length:321 start_codon:yes stop_codon:yes gene_type:complete